MSLDQIQRDFIRYLYAPQVSLEQQTQVRELFLRPEKPDPGNGLKTYRNNLIFALIQALRDTYGFTQALLGRENFSFFCRDYIYSHPSNHPDLIQYGGDFADFLAGREEIKHLPFIGDVARLEWAKDRAFYAPPEESASWDDWKKSKFPFRMKTSVSLIQSPYQIFNDYESFENGGIEAISDKPFPPGEEHLVVWSDQGTPRVIPVTLETAVFIKATRQGRSLEEIYQEQVFSQNPNAFKSCVFSLFQQGWVQPGPH
jgi:hypothetical protein